MKIKFTVILILLTAISTLFAGANIVFISAKSEGENIKIEWQSGTETNLKNYVIERSPVSLNSFTEITTIAPKGSNSSYSFVDKSAYKTTDAVFVYRLNIVDNDGQVTRFRSYCIFKSIWRKKYMGND